ncbi:unnamed protein product [Lampetra fluviatilis]
MAHISGRRYVKAYNVTNNLKMDKNDVGSGRTPLPPACGLCLLCCCSWFYLGPDLAHARDFTAHDVVKLYPSTTPHPGGFKCFTCENARDNFECNRWAPDTYCPKESEYCHTRHVMATDGRESVLVSKRCSQLRDCMPVGCQRISNGRIECISCCEGSICNLPVPYNDSQAIFVTISPSSRVTPVVAHLQGVYGGYLAWLWVYTIMLESNTW